MNNQKKNFKIIYTVSINFIAPTSFHVSISIINGVISSQDELVILVIVGLKFTDLEPKLML